MTDRVKLIQFMPLYTLSHFSDSPSHSWLLQAATETEKEGKWRTGNILMPQSAFLLKLVNSGGNCDS